MRIVGGKFRGRKLVAPASSAIRPTSDRIRESLFNVISHTYGEYLDNARVLDVFAGTGALGIEAISRGAEFTLFVEKSGEGCKLIRQNIEKFDLQHQAEVFRRDATRLGKPEETRPFDLVFLDPPYGRNLGEKAIFALLEGNWLMPASLLVLEEEKSAAPDFIDGFELLEQRHYAITTIGIFRRP